MIARWIACLTFVTLVGCPVPVETETPAGTLEVAVEESGPPYRLGLTSFIPDAVKEETMRSIEAMLDDAAELGAGGVRLGGPHDLPWYTKAGGNAYFGPGTGGYSNPSYYDFAGKSDRALLHADGLYKCPIFFGLANYDTTEGYPAIPYRDADGTDRQRKMSFYSNDEGFPTAAGVVAEHIAAVIDHYWNSTTPIMPEYWEVINEPSNFSKYKNDDGTGACYREYTALLDVFHSKLPVCQPGGKIVLGGIVGTKAGALDNSTTWLENLLSPEKNPDWETAARSIDVVNFHYYDEWTLFLSRVQRIAALRDLRLPGKPIWMTEFGRSALPLDEGIGVPGDTTKQCQDLWRIAVMAFGNGVELVNWFCLIGSEGVSGSAFAGMGLRENKAGAPKRPSWYSYQKFTQKLGSFTTCTIVRQETGNVWCYRFDVDGASKWVAWTDLPDLSFDLKSADLLAPAVATTTNVVPTDAGEFEVSQGVPTASLMLSPSPLLIEP